MEHKSSIQSIMEVAGADVADLNLDDMEWTLLEKLVAALKPSKTATINLQAKNLTMSNFYKIWTVCRIQTQNLGTLMYEYVTISHLKIELCISNFIKRIHFHLFIFSVHI